MRNITVTVQVNFPALDNLVAYLKSTQQHQSQIDALATHVKELTDSLHVSSTALQGAVDKNP